MRSIIRHPTDKRNLAPGALTTLELILDIKHRIPPTNALLALLVLALGVEQLFAEGGVIRAGGGLLDHDLLVVVRDLVDDPLGGFAQLEVVEGLDAFGGDGDTVGIGRLVMGRWAEWSRGAWVDGEAEASRNGVEDDMTYPDCACRKASPVSTLHTSMNRHPLTYGYIPSCPTIHVVLRMNKTRCASFNLEERLRVSPAISTTPRRRRPEAYLYQECRPGGRICFEEAQAYEIVGDECSGNGVCCGGTE